MPKTLSFQLFTKTNKMRKFYYKEKKMEIKQKHGKHALRKAVTAAVLAGTAFSSLGGFAGAVTTVKADNVEKDKIAKDFKDLDQFIVEKKSDERLHRISETEILEELSKLLSGFSNESLNELISQLDRGRLEYPFTKLEGISRVFGTYNSDFSNWRQRSIGLETMIISEVKKRVDENEEKKQIIIEKERELDALKEIENNLRKGKEEAEGVALEASSKVKIQEEELLKKEAELKENKEELMETLEDLEKVKESVKEKEASVKDLTEKLETSKKNHAELAEEFEKTKGEYEKELSENDKKLSEAAKQNSELVTENKELKENLEMAEGISDDLQKKVMKAEQEVKDLSAQLEAAKEELETEKAKLADSEKANEKLTEERDAAKKEAEKVPELEEQVEKLVEEITAAKKEAEELQAKAEALEKDFEAVKAEKEKLEAEIAKMKEDHQKEVDALNALLSDKEKMLKNLQDQLDKAKEEAMKNEQMSQEEKAKLQAELDKAKQELADNIKDMPNKVAPQAEGKANAGQAAPNQNQNNQAQANQTKNANNLPSTGDKPVNPLLVASGLSLMIGAGAFVYAGKRKKG